MASSIARGRVGTTTTTATATESRNMAATLQIIGWQRHAALVYRVLLWYWTSMLWSIDACENKVSADRPSPDHIAGSSVQLIEVTCFLKWWFSIGSRAHVRFTCWKQGRIVRKPANASPGLKFSPIITFSSIQIFFAALFLVYGDYKTQNRKSNS